jgi:hypothetical protein
MSHPDLDALLNVLLPFAQEMLAKRGDFLPFGASMGNDGEIAMAAASVSDPETPERLLGALEDGLRTRASASAIRAAGVCVDVRVRHPDSDQVTDAIQARLEHASSAANDRLRRAAPDPRDARRSGSAPGFRSRRARISISGAQSSVTCWQYRHADRSNIGQLASRSRHLFGYRARASGSRPDATPHHPEDG